MANDIGPLLSSQNGISPVLGHVGLLQKYFRSFRKLLSLLSTGTLGFRGGWSKKKFDPFLVFLARVSGASKKVFGSYLVPLARAWVRVLAGISSVTPGAGLRPLW